MLGEVAGKRGREWTATDSKMDGVHCSGIGRLLEDLKELDWGRLSWRKIMWSRIV